MSSKVEINTNPNPANATPFRAIRNGSFGSTGMWSGVRTNRDFPTSELTGQVCIEIPFIQHGHESSSNALRYHPFRLLNPLSLFYSPSLNVASFPRSDWRSLSTVWDIGNRYSGRNRAHLLSRFACPFLSSQRLERSTLTLPRVFNIMETASSSSTTTTNGSVNGMPAPYGRACTNCARAKCRCIYRTGGADCER